ncbi:hypothetical protein KAFR_0F01980 [Kazachstania africana CBS 2517]|uniref:Uncharacterized protein n=1 Tax=Kazachstania africana (strain ATCC 22294 / BCRC 22015 / CBS 2517 / CECT 1963 / NBRC 1671 / NRRL Y-8276) TaxID=1071382 RepID=H2AWP5_KAZAF|nr:hypothetical protein KAFR_0F01980 [Kazachstania africana CBS 2517]CCF58795.1 hypothetical protein KAFR_0F01980 [Kazachstania africana CBS 2517]
MISQATKRLAQVKLSPSRIVRAKNSAAFKKTAGNSFGSFKEYRETAKTYGPLSASIASKRNLTHC